MSEQKLTKNVLLIATDEVARAANGKWDPKYNDIDPNIYVVSKDDISDIAKAEGVELELNGNVLAPGLVLMRDPIYPKLYYPIEDGEKNSFKSQVYAICEIAKDLGAEHIRCSTKVTSKKTTSLNIIAKIRARIRGFRGKADGTYQETSEEELQLRYDRNDKCDPMELTVEKYKEVCEKATHFAKNEEIVSLLNFRNPNAPGKGREREVTIHISEALNNARKITGSLSGRKLRNTFKIDGEVITACSHIRTVDYKLEIKFYPIKK